MHIEFWKATGIRALRTFLQVILGTWTAGQLITTLNWKVILLSALSAAVYSVLTSIFTGLPEVDITHEITNEEAEIQIEEGDPEYYEYNEEVDEDE